MRCSRPSAPPTTRDHLARLCRGLGNGEALAAAYAAWAETEPEPRCAAALWCARGIVDLERGDYPEAEESLLRAARLAPADPFCRAALAEVYPAEAMRHCGLRLAGSKRAQAPRRALAGALRTAMEARRVLPSPALAAELQAFVKEHIAPYKFPRWVEFRIELPMTATGKIQRFKLRAGFA